MAWYHWIAVYIIIIGFGVITIIPNKPLWLWVLLISLIVIGLLLGVFLPHKEDKYAKKNLEG